MENLEGMNSNMEGSHIQEGGNSQIGQNTNQSHVVDGNNAINTSTLLPDQITFSSLLNGDNEDVEEQMICDFAYTIPREEPSDKIVNITSENVTTMERYQNLNISLEKEGLNANREACQDYGGKKYDIGINLNQTRAQSPLLEAIDTPMRLPQPIIFGSLLKKDDLVVEEQMLSEFQSSFSEEEPSDEIVNITSENVTTMERYQNLNISLEKSNFLRAHGESISFGRYMSESLDWGKWSVFKQNRYVEEAKKYSKPGSVAAKIAYFEAQNKRRAAEKAVALVE